MKIKFLISGFLIFFLCGCASQEPSLEQKLDYAQQKQLMDIQDLSLAGESQKALNELNLFRESHKESIYYQASRLSEAKIYYDLQDFNKSLEIYEDILSLGPEKYPLIWARARYESTLIFEALGNDEKAIATLTGLENSQHLADEVKFAEVPARLAGLYSRQGNEKEVAGYLDRADRGLKFLMGRTDLNREKSWLAETLYRMGKMSMSPLTEANMGSQLQSQSRQQVYLLRSAEQDVPLWSQKAADELIQSYQKEWAFIQTHWDSNESRKDKIGRIKELHQLISEAMYRKPSDPELSNSALKAYYDYATKLEGQVSQALFSGKDITPYSIESEKMNDVKKSGQVEVTQVFPEEKLPQIKIKLAKKNLKKVKPVLPAKTEVPSDKKDPNL